MIKLDLAKIPDNERFSAWIEAVDITRTKVPNLGHFYIYKSQKSKSEYLLSHRGMKLDPDYCRLSLQEVLDTAIELQAKDSLKINANPILMPLKEKVKERYYSGLLGLIRKAASAVFSFFSFERSRAGLRFEKLAEKNGSWNLQSQENRDKINLISDYLTSKAIPLPAVFNATKRLEALETVLEENWKAMLAPSKHIRIGDLIPYAPNPCCLQDYFKMNSKMQALFLKSLPSISYEYFKGSVSLGIKIEETTSLSPELIKILELSLKQALKDYFEQVGNKQTLSIMMMPEPLAPIFLEELKAFSDSKDAASTNLYSDKFRGDLLDLISRFKSFNIIEEHLNADKAILIVHKIANALKSNSCQLQSFSFTVTKEALANTTFLNILSSLEKPEGPYHWTTKNAPYGLGNLIAMSINSDMPIPAAVPLLKKEKPAFLDPIKQLQKESKPVLYSPEEILEQVKLRKEIQEKREAFLNKLTIKASKDSK